MIFEKFEKTVKRHRMLSGGERLVAGVSGGVDSMVLLHLLDRFVRRYGGGVVVAHLNHGLRGNESERDEDFVRAAAGEMDIPFMSRKVEIGRATAGEGLNVQDAGRRERYRFFEDVLKDVNGDRIVLGHNADDQAETVLMRIIRGTGIRGLGGIPPVRGRIVRPLIELTREEIEDYASREGIRYVEDSSNLEEKYLRNRVRRELIPLLMEYNPGASRELNLLSDIARDVDRYIDDEAMRAYESAGCETGDGAESIALDRQAMNSLPAPVRARVIQIALKEVSGDSSGFFSRHIIDVADLAAKEGSGDSIDLPKNVMVMIEYDRVLFSRCRQVETPDFSYALKLSGETHVPEAGLTLLAKEVGKDFNGAGGGKNSVYLDMEKITFPLEVRNFRRGDRIRLKGMRGRKMLKDFFIDEKIPKRERKKIPLLVSGDDILWIVGWREGSAAMADGKNARTLQVVKVCRKF